MERSPKIKIKKLMLKKWHLIMQRDYIKIKHKTVLRELFNNNGVIINDAFNYGLATKKNIEIINNYFENYERDIK
jgi:hypothetical protein